MTRFMSLGLTITVLMLSACQMPNPPAKPKTVLRANSGYFCTAMNKRPGGHQATAWADNRLGARRYALSRCQSRSRYPDACRIKTCWWTGSVTTVSRLRYYTCYVMNRQRQGVWSGTSHNRVRAVKWAYNRCQRYSGKFPKACYVSYCRIW